MITEDYCSFNISKMLEKNGMAALNHAYYDKEGIIHDVMELDAPEAVVAAHTHQMACKWLREVHKIGIENFVTYKDKIPHYQWRIECLNNQDTIVDNPCCSTYEEAVEAAIKYCLENLI